MSESIDSAQNRYPRVGRIDTPSLRMDWSEAPWDSAIYGAPVLQISRLEVGRTTTAQDFATFERAREMAGSNIVTCRLSHECLRESMLLEEVGFRFIEMMYLPELDPLTLHQASGIAKLEVRQASETDLPQVVQIAGSAFRNERFHVDPRLPAELSDKRYQNWARSSLAHTSQRLFVVCEKEMIVAFFVNELLADGTCYWHLNAVAAGFQGKGYGRRAWSAMIENAKASGAKRIRTSIVARNHRVLNLYARLGFRFPPPLMTFHWVRPT